MQLKSKFSVLMILYQNWCKKLGIKLGLFTIHRWAKDSSQYHLTNCWRIMKTFTVTMWMKFVKLLWRISWETRIQMLTKQFKSWKNIHMKQKLKGVYNSWTTVKWVGYLWVISRKNNATLFQSHLKQISSLHPNFKTSRSNVSSCKIQSSI